MKRFFLASIVLATAACGSADGTDMQSSVPETTASPAMAEPPMLGAHWTRDESAAQQEKTLRRGTSPLMTNHGGKSMPTVVAKAIFWGPSWATYSGDEITGIDSWYVGHNGSNYAATVNEYTGINGKVGSTGLVYQGHIIDTSTATGGGSTSTILAEVCKQVTAGNIVPDPGGNGYYPVYTDVPRGSASYCAWHSAGTCGKQAVQFAYFFKLDGDSGCDPQDTSGLHSQGLAALASVTAHELSEARSDPASPGAWYDSKGSENGDKCAWTFGAPLVTFSNGTKWRLQSEWSNAAYTAGTGYANSSGQLGCLSGL